MPRLAAPRLEFAVLDQRLDGADVAAGLAVAVVDEALAGAAVAEGVVDVDRVGPLFARLAVELGQLECLPSVRGHGLPPVADPFAFLGNRHRVLAFDGAADPQGPHAPLDFRDLVTRLAIANLTLFGVCRGRGATNTPGPFRFPTAKGIALRLV
jgi:hypothetical protein